MALERILSGLWDVAVEAKDSISTYGDRERMIKDFESGKIAKMVDLAFKQMAERERYEAEQALIMHDYRINMEHGQDVEFHGRLTAEVKQYGKKGGGIRLQVYETKAGQWVCYEEKFGRGRQVFSSRVAHFDQLEKITRFFGGIPAAKELYQKIGISTTRYID